MATKTTRIAQTKPGEGGTPLHTAILEDGTKRHTMADGRVFEEAGPSYLLTYQSFMPDSTYTREISIFGLSPDNKHLFEGWCYVYNALRTYAFDKVVSLTEISTGTELSGEELRNLMKGEIRADKE